MFGLFNRSKKTRNLLFKVDMHSHLLPGLDDGVKSIEESLYIFKILRDLGYRKVITTPHIMHDQYPNTPEEIMVKASEVRRALEKEQINIEIQAGAEYYLDEQLAKKLDKNEKLLTFHQNYLLFETSFMNKPVFLEEAIFNMNTNGYQPVLAHPERYVYLQSDKKLIEQLKNMNVLFQINMLSLFGYYSSEVKKNAKNLISSNLVDFIGTDCHNAFQADEIMKFANSKKSKQLFSLNLRNSSLV